MGLVLAEGRWRRDFAGTFLDGTGDAEFAQRRHQRGIEVGDALRPQRQAPRIAVAHGDVEHVLIEIEFNLEAAGAVRDGRGGQSLARSRTASHASCG